MEMAQARARLPAGSTDIDRPSTASFGATGALTATGRTAPGVEDAKVVSA
jgi:hypothetical protein